MSLFSKEFLSKEVEKTERNEAFRLYPKERRENPRDITPFDTVISSKIRYFDQKSAQIKDIMSKARKEISEKCFNNNSTFPNQGSIDQCIRAAEDEYRKLDYLRETHFANIFYKHKKDLENCPSNNVNCIQEADQTLVWNANKLPYFFMENY